MGWALVLFSTPYGIGIDSDSVAYIAGANNLLAGRGISESSGGDEVKPITHWPPFYSISLAGAELLGLRQEVAARRLGAVLFAGNVIIAGLVVSWMTGSGLMALVGAWAILMSAPLIYLHSFAMSEPLYLLLSLAGLLVLSIYLRREGQGILLAAAVLISLAYLTRYAGISVVAAGAAGVLFLGKQAVRRRVRDAGIYLIITLGPMAAWMIRNASLTGTATNRRIVAHSLTLSMLKIPFSFVWRTFLPFEFSYPALWGMIALVVAVLVLLLFSGRWRDVPRVIQRLSGELPEKTLGVLIVLYGIAYIGVLTLTVLFLDASTPVDDRLTSPLIEAVLLMAVACSWAMWRVLSGRSIYRAALVAVGVLLLMSYPIESARSVGDLRVDGRGYANTSVRNSRILGEVRGLPPGIVIYTNERQLVYFYAGRGSYSIPVKYNSATGETNDYQPSLKRMRQDLKDRGGVVVIFDSISTQNAYPPLEELILGMRPLVEVEGGAIYGYSQLPIGLPSSLSKEGIGVARMIAVRRVRS